MSTIIKASVAVPEEASVRMYRHLTRHYIAALVTLAIIAIASQILVQYQLARQAADSRVINIAGRQRMLSQRISKDTLALSSINNSAMLHHYRKELQQNIALWERSHQGLQQGDAELGLPGINSATVRGMFAQQQPYYDELLETAKQISERNLPPTPTQLETILANEPRFLELMDQIVFQYDSEASARVDQLRVIQVALLGLLLLTLLLQGVFIFRPALRQMRAHIDEIEAERLRTQEAAARLNASNHELQTTTTELAKINTRLQQQEQQQQQHITQLEAYQQAIRRMSTPVVPVADGVLVVPLIGELDSERAATFEHVLLQAISHHDTHTVIVDVTGLVLHHAASLTPLLQAVQAAHLLGAHTILTGVTPQIAHALVAADVELEQIQTFTTLQQGVAAAARVAR